MDAEEIERLRLQNLARVTQRALDACSRDTEPAKVELEILLTGPHGQAVALALLEVAAATRAVVKRNAPIWRPFGAREVLLYELVLDHSDVGIRRVKNLLDAGWDPNLAVEGTHRTALMQVTNSWSQANRDLAALLLAAGADPRARSVGGQTALDYAPVSMRNFIQNFIRDIDQDTTNRTARTERRP